MSAPRWPSSAPASTPVREAAEHYLSLGWRIVPVPHRQKAPAVKGWPDFQVDTDGLVTALPEPSNIGVILGAVSGGLVDIDLDCPEAVELAPEFLPDTWTFGRPSKPRSHWLFVVPGGASTRKFLDVPDSKNQRQTLLELRAGRLSERRVQTVFPPSTHPSGEPIRWTEDCDATEAPLTIEREALTAHLEGLAVATLLRRHAPRPLVDAWLHEGGPFPTVEAEVLEQARRMTGGALVADHSRTRPVHEPARSADFAEAVRRYNAEQARDLPRSGAECPLCGHRDCFGRLGAEPHRWACFSTGHSSGGIAGDGCWTGDLLDIDAHQAGATPARHLTASGYLGGAS